MESMVKRGETFLALSLVLLILIPAPTSPPSAAPAVQVSGGQEQGESPRAEEGVEASPRSLKEKWGIVVFLGWLWLSVGFLVYCLRLKIKELDRLHRIRFFSGGRK